VFRFYGSESVLFSWDYPATVETCEYGSNGAYVTVGGLPGAVESSYVNRAWDSTLGDYVRWLTYYIDSSGQEYPGPSAWSAVSSSYCVEAIKFGRSVG